MRTTLVDRLTVCTVLLASALAMPARAQTKLVVQPKYSLAWWQLNPHLNHLWATTCPGEPSWRAGEGRSLAWASQFLAMRSKTGYAAVLDTIIPLYPRRKARPLCEDAVSGEVISSDTVMWNGAHGFIQVRAEALTTGLDMRDNYARKSVMQTSSYPYIRFEIDSVEGMTKLRGDTLKGVAYGKLTLHGVTQPSKSDFRTWSEPAGRRVKAQFMIPAEDMTDKFQMSKMSLGLGVGGAVWQELHMGVDLILGPAGS